MSLLDSLRSAAEHPEFGDKGLREHLDRVAQRVETQDGVMSENSRQGPVDFILEIFRRGEDLTRLEDGIDKNKGYN
jgi:hypothetical protein